MNKLWTPDKRIHLPGPDLVGFYLEVGAWDKAGKLYHQERIRSRSPLKQFLQMLAVQMNPEVTQDITDVDGVSQSSLENISNFKTDALLNDDTFGIVIGTGDTAVDITDYALVAKIADGTGSGQMIYNAMAFDATVTVSDPDCTWDLWRNFNNNSGASITVKETGSIFQGSAASRLFLMVRDVPTEVAVPDGGGCYVKYTLKITE